MSSRAVSSLLPSWSLRLIVESSVIQNPQPLLGLRVTFHSVHWRVRGVAVVVLGGPEAGTSFVVWVRFRPRHCIHRQECFGLSRGTKVTVQIDPTFRICTKWTLNFQPCRTNAHYPSSGDTTSTAKHEVPKARTT